MLNKVILVPALVISLLGTSSPASATPIVYTGSQQVGQIQAIYSITTDGTLGEIDTDHLTAFDVSLSEGGQPPLSYSRNPSGGTGSWSGFVIASSTSLTIAAFDALSLYTNATNQAGGYAGSLTFRSNATLAQVTDSAYPNGLAQSASRANDVTPFATAIAAVPEPASWVLIVLGVGVVGAAMRRRVRASEIRFDARIKRLSEGGSA